MAGCLKCCLNRRWFLCSCIGLVWVRAIWFQSKWISGNPWGWMSSGVLQRGESAGDWSSDHTFGGGKKMTITKMGKTSVASCYSKSGLGSSAVILAAASGYPRVATSLLGPLPGVRDSELGAPALPFHSHLAPLSYTCFWVASVTVTLKLYEWWFSGQRVHCSCILAGYSVIKYSLCSYGEGSFFFEWTSGSTNTIPWKRFRHGNPCAWAIPLNGHL